MRFDILTIFPHCLDSYINESILKIAQKKKRITLRFHDIRVFTKDAHHSVDDKPYGGGPGMLMKVDVIYRCLCAVVGQNEILKKLKTKNSKPKSTTQKSKIILLGPRGEQFTQKKAQEFSKLDKLVLIAGRYEGIDARVENLVDEIISVGPYVLSGGELPAMVVVETVARLIHGVLGKEESLQEESFTGGCAKEYPHYTRPEVFSPLKGVEWKVPDVLLSGNHKKIEEWRKGRATF